MHAHIHDVPDAAITEDLSGVSPKCLVAGSFREHEPQQVNSLTPTWHQWRVPPGAVTREVRAILAETPRLVMTLKGRNRADPFVVALAKIRGATAVTGEGDDGNEKHPKIPYACAKRGVTCTKFSALIRNERWRLLAE